MRSLIRACILVVLVSSIVAEGESVGSLYTKGQNAEVRQDYEAAYEYYKAAHDLKPNDLKYRVPYERTRFLAAASKIRRAQKLREQGKLEEALDVFQKAAEIDPGNDLARQEIRRTLAIMSGQPVSDANPAPAQPPPQAEDPLRKRVQEASTFVDLAPIEQPLQAVEMTNNSKYVYETLGRLAGINVLFDSDYSPKAITVHLQNVSVRQALDIVALESRTFWRPVTPNTIFVAQDSTTKRHEVEQNAIKTFYLGNVGAPTDLQDAVNVLRTILDVQKVQQIISQSAIIVRGTPDQLALAQKILDDIDKAKPEVIVDIVVAQVRRDKVRTMGLVPPQNASVTLVPPGTTTTAAGGTPTTTTNTLNFNNLQHLNSTSYSVTVDPLTAKLLFSDDNTKIIQSPQIRASDGQQAKLKIGDRIPVASGSFGTPLGVGTGVGLGVNTQFQYLDVGVNIEMTPRVHPGNEITLKMSLEISNQTGTSTIGGISQPIISQRKVEHEIRLKDGEMNLLGGILEDTETLNNSGVPFLSRIPLLKYLFAQEDKEKHTNEVVFLLIPHIVRGQELTEINRRAIDVGNGNTGIDLHLSDKPAAAPENSSGLKTPPRASADSPTTPAAGSGRQANVSQQPSPSQPVQPAQQQPVQQQPAPAQQQPAQQPQPAPQQAQQQIGSAQPAVAPASQQSAQLPPALIEALKKVQAQDAANQASQPAGAIQNPQVPPPAQSQPVQQPQTQPQPAAAIPQAAISTNAGATPVALRIDPTTATPARGSSFSLNVNVSGGQDVYSVPMKVTYDPKVLEFVNVSNGDFLTRDGQKAALARRDDPDSGTVQVSITRPPGVGGVSGNGTIFTLVFTAKAKGSGVVAVTTPGARNSQNQPLQAMTSQATITVN
ncbi:MAG TPA: cohesin domain-containing protein [Candidatus Angelobacter sp.]|nr:cohesin domain-containing protein [Candidatus Angelobacter sp.]